jgi:hypothetical protein
MENLRVITYAIPTTCGGFNTRNKNIDKARWYTRVKYISGLPCLLPNRKSANVFNLGHMATAPLYRPVYYGSHVGSAILTTYSSESVQGPNSFPAKATKNILVQISTHLHKLFHQGHVPSQKCRRI